MKNKSIILLLGHIKSLNFFSLKKKKKTIPFKPHTFKWHVLNPKKSIDAHIICEDWGSDLFGFFGGTFMKIWSLKCSI